MLLQQLEKLALYEMKLKDSHFSDSSSLWSETSEFRPDTPKRGHIFGSAACTSHWSSQLECDALSLDGIVHWQIFDGLWIREQHRAAADWTWYLDLGLDSVAHSESQLEFR